MKKITIPIVSDDARTRVLQFLGIIHKFHKLTDKEINIVVEFILQYYDISQSLRNPEDAETINKLLFATESRKVLQQNLGIKEDVFNNYLSKLRKKGVLVSGKLNPNYIPPHEKFSLEFNFI